MRKGPHPLPVHLGLISSHMSAVDGNILITPAKKIDQCDLVRMMEGIQKYQSHPYKRSEDGYKEYWSNGCCRLISKEKSPSASKPVLLVIPSLINGYEIFDIYPDQSFIDFSYDNDVQLFALDWGDLAPSQYKNISFESLVHDVLQQAVDVLSSVTKNGVHILGYCMGGLISIAAADMLEGQVKSLTLLATPWDFHAKDFEFAKYLRISHARNELTLSSRSGPISYTQVQILFAALDPLSAVEKFKKFSRLDQDCAKAELFVAVEDWLNNGTDLPEHVAHYCMSEWFKKNTPYLDQFQVGDRHVNVSNFLFPTYVISSCNDKIVTNDSAAAILNNLPNAQHNEVSLGHVGMMIGRCAKEQVWKPVMKFIKNNDEH